MNQLCCCLAAQSCLTLCHAVGCCPPAPLSTGFSRQEYWSGLPFPNHGDLPDPRIKIVSPALAGQFFTTEPQGKEAQWIAICIHMSPPCWASLAPRPPSQPSRAPQSCKLRYLCSLQVPISYLFCTCSVYMSILIPQFVQPSPSPTGSTCQWAITSQKSEWSALENLQTINAGRDAERRELFCTVGGKVNWHSHYGDQDGHSLTV